MFLLDIQDFTQVCPPFTEAHRRVGGVLFQLGIYDNKF